jgi:hypothetical protein
MDGCAIRLFRHSFQSSSSIFLDLSDSAFRSSRPNVNEDPQQNHRAQRQTDMHYSIRFLRLHAGVHRTPTRRGLSYLPTSGSIRFMFSRKDAKPQRQVGASSSPSSPLASLRLCARLLSSSVLPSSSLIERLHCTAKCRKSSRRARKLSLRHDSLRLAKAHEA